jgi:hypothetical protein
MTGPELAMLAEVVGRLHHPAQTEIGECCCV